MLPIKCDCCYVAGCLQPSVFAVWSYFKLFLPVLPFWWTLNRFKRLTQVACRVPASELTSTRLVVNDNLSVPLLESFHSLSSLSSHSIVEARIVDVSQCQCVDLYSALSHSASNIVLWNIWNWSDDNNTVSGIAIIDTTAVPEMRYASSVSFRIHQSQTPEITENVCSFVCLYCNYAVVCCVLHEMRSCLLIVTVITV